MACDYACSGEEDAFGEEQFYDARDDLSSGSGQDCCSVPDLDYNIWIENRDSIQERRRRFRRNMDLSFVGGSFLGSSFDLDGLEEDSEGGPFDNGFGGRLSASCGHSGIFKEEVMGMENSGDRLASQSMDGAGFCSMIMPFEFLRSDESWASVASSPPTSTRRYIGKSVDRSSILGRQDRTICRRKVGLLRRLGIVACVAPRQEEEDGSMQGDSHESACRKASRVKVHHCGKQSKEFSALYMGQDVKAHDGAICTMKFSPDGQYLATGGEDRVVRVWQVLECDFMGGRDLPQDDPCCICFMANHDFDLDPMHKSKEKKPKPGILSRLSDAACIIIPPKVFQISEKPLHEFRGHKGEVLDLSWSKNKFLLSASEDKSVRLWKVGSSECIKSFPHNDYVTCVQFDPMDDNFFVSGSLDCKIRIWDISDCHVISWSDVKEMVTAVCYKPDAKGIVAGSMGGVCSFYQISDDNHLQLNERIHLQSKKKYHSKRITGFQYSPTDPGKLMVTSADSQIKILDGMEVIGKYKGFRNATSQISASFTTDGRHIVSASEDSNVHIWNHGNQGLSPKANRLRCTQSREYFFSPDVVVALPWYPPGSKERLSMASGAFSSQCEPSSDLKGVSEAQCQSNISCRSSRRFGLNPRFFNELLLPKGSATWPEEKLPSSAKTPPPLSKSDLKFLRACCEKALASHAWGQVIVAAGLDGRIKSYSNYGLPVGG